jgi:hypothetical protein
MVHGAMVHGARVQAIGWGISPVPVPWCMVHDAWRTAMPMVHGHGVPWCMVDGVWWTVYGGWSMVDGVWWMPSIGWWMVDGLWWMVDEV